MTYLNTKGLGIKVGTKAYIMRSSHKKALVTVIISDNELKTISTVE